MVVPVPVVLRVPVPVVKVVDVVAVEHGIVSAVLAVPVLVPLMGDVIAGLALVPVVGVPPVQMAVVRVVDMVAMRHFRVPAVRAVGVLMGRVFQVFGGHVAHILLTRRSSTPLGMPQNTSAAAHTARATVQRAAAAACLGARAAGPLSPVVASVRMRRWATARKPSQSAQHRAPTTTRVAVAPP
jgi:hypothetical protein